MSTGHREAPLVLDLLAHVKIQLSNQQTVTGAAQRRSPAAVRCSHVSASIEVSEISVGFLSIATSELVGEDLSSDSVDANSEVVVSDGGISGLDAPKRFRKSIDSG